MGSSRRSDLRRSESISHDHMALRCFSTSTAGRAASLRRKAVLSRGLPDAKSTVSRRHAASDTNVFGAGVDRTSLLGASVCVSLFAEGTLSRVEAAEGPLLPGIGILQGTILVAPVLLYAAFTVYRTAFNRSAKISDFLFLVAGVVIFGNILSALILKVRLF